MEVKEDVLECINKKLSILIGLKLDEDEKLKVKDKVAKLARFDISSTEIADILGISKNYASKELSLKRKTKNRD